MLLAAASLVTSFLGGQALAKPTLSGELAVRPTIGAWGWLAIAAFCAIFVLTILIIFPYTWKFQQSAHKLIEWYEAQPKIPSLEFAQRELALHLENDYDSNERRLRWLFWCLKAAAALLTLETIAWVVDIAS
jgi:hypothetical protein